MDGPDMELASKETAAVLRNLAADGWMSEQPAAFQGRMAKIGRWMSIRRGQVIYAAGDEADAIYGLGEGLLDVSIPVDSQRDVVIHRATAGFWIGDSALLAGSLTHTHPFGRKRRPAVQASGGSGSPQPEGTPRGLDLLLSSQPSERHPGPARSGRGDFPAAARAVCPGADAPHLAGRCGARHAGRTRANGGNEPRSLSPLLRGAHQPGHRRGRIRPYSNPQSAGPGDRSRPNGGVAAGSVREQPAISPWRPIM